MTRILIVEDEVTLAMLAEMTLEDEGYEVLTAPDGNRGLDAIRAKKPDLVITDFMMPGMDGLEMLRILREEGVEVPVIITSGVPEAQLPAGDDARYEAYLQKPYHERVLVELVAHHLPGKVE